MPKWLRVVLIIVICLVLLAATAIFLLLWALGAFRHFSADDTAQMGIIAVYVILLAAGVTGILFLARGFRAPVAMSAYAGEAGIAPQYAQSAPLRAEPDPEAEPNPEKVMYLRLAMAAKIGVSVISLLIGIASRMIAGNRSYAATMPVSITLGVSFAAFNAPYALLIALRKLEKFALALTLTFPCAFLLADVYRVLTIMMRTHMPLQFLASTAIGMALEVTIFVLALRLKEHIGADAGSFIAGAAALSIVYVIAITLMIPMLTGMLYRMM